MTPRGSLVEPDVYCRNARPSGSTADRPPDRTSAAASSEDRQATSGAARAAQSRASASVAPSVSTTVAREDAAIPSILSRAPEPPDNGGTGTGTRPAYIEPRNEVRNCAPDG